MRVLYVLILALTLYSCSKSENPELGLIGTWIWLESSGGITGQISTPESSGKSQKLIISKDSVWSFVNGVLEGQTKYKTEKKESVILNSPREMIIYEGNRIRQLLEVDGNMLYLTDDCFDCFSHRFRRASN